MYTRYISGGLVLLSCVLNPFWFRTKVNHLYSRDERLAKLKLAQSK
jgi:hypothetical protein